MKRRHIPLRTCVACGEKRSKGQLIRIVRSPQGNVTVDPTGKGSGRGAYLCRSRSCWEKGLSKNRLEYVLRGAIPQEARDSLASFAKTIDEGQESLDPVEAGMKGGANQ